eukprot:TRINITY_DN18491_c0_g1_i1.p2 TRINITY_DN18491_c0_g1~~TRINITY_DN18491_c0_g1_i1.p2  ORF type:complete len:152 (+),score=9.38 TRINITY_DN18491_c0_g1_i1:85-540(+)
MASVIVVRMVHVGFASELVIHIATLFMTDSIFACLFLAGRLIQLSLVGVRSFFRGSDWRWNVFETVLAVTSITELLWIAAISFTGESASPLMQTVRLGRVAKIVLAMRVHIFMDGGDFEATRQMAPRLIVFLSLSSQSAKLISGPCALRVW